MQSLKERLGFGKKKPQWSDLATSEGNIRITNVEKNHYRNMMLVADADEDGQLSGQEGALFLSRSGLTRDQLREVWRLACGGTSKPKLAENDWFIACKIVALAQHTGTCALTPLLENPTLPLPQFQFEVKPVADHSPLPPLAKGAMVIRVGSPVRVGSALSKHIEYTIHTLTSLPQFPFKEVSVQRRYSDFLWLHNRLCTVFAGCLIPRFPAKKMMGNMDATFVEDRRHALATYVNKVARHARLVTSVDLMVFCGASPKAFAAAKAIVTENEAIYNGGIDLMKLVGAVTGSRGMVTKTDEEFVAQCSKSSASLARLERTVTTSDAVQTARKNVAYELSRVGAYSSTVGVHERAGTTAGAGASAASEARRKEEARTLAALGAGGGAGAGSGGGSAAPMTAAESAFAAHTAAGARDTNSIEAMFNVDFDDPLATPVAAVPTFESAEPELDIMTPEMREAERRAAIGKVEAAQTPADLFQRFGAESEAIANRLQDQIDRLDEVFFKPILMEKEKEAEIQQAANRRTLAVSRTQAANQLLTRRKRTYASIRASSGGGVGGKAEAAEAAVKDAEKRLKDCQDALVSITDALKADMIRVEKERRVNLVTRLAEMVKLEVTQARARSKAWSDLLPFISDDRQMIKASQDKVTAVPDPSSDDIKL